MPFFSVIIPVYNRHNFVIHAIETVFVQSYKDFEIIVVDDGSTDSTPSIADRYSGKIVYIRQENRGVSAARNAGVRISSSPWIAFLDSDDRWLPDKLKRQAEYIASRQEVKILQTEEEWIRKGRKVNPKQRHCKKEGRIFIDSLDTCLISPSSVVMHRTLFDRYGLFDEDMPACEDYDLWLRITKDEWVGLIPEKLLIKYGGHEDQLSAKFWGMDRFRVYSILKLLDNFSGSLPHEYHERAITVAQSKTRILLDGALKRGKTEFTATLRTIMQMIQHHDFKADGYRKLITNNY